MTTVEMAREASCLPVSQWLCSAPLHALLYNDSQANSHKQPNKKHFSIFPQEKGSVVPPGCKNWKAPKERDEFHAPRLVVYREL